jgi:LPPG:FO 2-phospho-L-lactate transferase
MLIDRSDEGERDEIESLGMRVLVTDAVMRDDGDRERLAHETLGFAEEISRSSGRVA